MTYDNTARKVGVKAIAKVESNNDYGAINYNDPITVGVVQWFGDRAANILTRMRRENAAAWNGVTASINNDLTTYDKNNYGYWSSRYLTSVEGESLRPVLRANVTIQNGQISDDFEGYKTVAISYGFNPDTNTKTVLFFFTMHHQSPASALRVVQTLDTTATLEQIHAAALADGTLGQYPGRLNEVYAIISAYDPSGITLPGEGGGDTDPVDPVDPVDPTDPTNPPATAGSERKDYVYIAVQGGVLLGTFKDKSRLLFYPDGHGNFIPRISEAKPVDPVDPVDPDPGDGGGGTNPPVTGEWTHPLPGSSITSPWGPRALDGFHYGDDLSMAVAGNVVAPHKMIIDVADGTSNASAGFYVSARGVGVDYTFKFYHMVAGSLTVSPGQTVEAGTKIGVMGNTGNSFGAHTHFEVYEGKLVNPWPPPYGPMTIQPSVLMASHGVTL